MREQLGIGDRFALGAARFVNPLVSAPTGGSFPASSERYDTLWHRPATTVIAGAPDAGFIDILPGSAAERSGLAIGDRIIAVDGQPASDLSLSDFGNRGAAPRKSVAVTMTNGRRVDLAISQFLP